MRGRRAAAIFLLTCATGLALAGCSVILVLLALTSLRRALTPAAFIAFSSLLLVGFCLHLALRPDVWLFRRGGRWHPGPKEWIGLGAQLVAAWAVVFSVKMMLYEVRAHYPGKFWLAVAAAGIVVFGAAAIADLGRGRRR